VFVSQMGPRQLEGIEFLTTQVLPLVS
jgi:hypothetical protein